MKARQISLGLVLTLVIAGCGGSTSSNAPEPNGATGAGASTINEPSASTVGAETSTGVGDACALLSTVDLSAAAGGSWGVPREVPGSESIECDYVDEATRTKFFVAVHSQGAVAAAGGPEAFVASRAYPAGAAGTEIDVGDGAFFFEFPHVRNFIVMLVGGEVVEISGETTFGIAFDQESMTAIALTVADSL